MVTATLYDVNSKEIIGVFKFIIPPNAEDVIITDKQWVVLKRGHEYTRSTEGKVKVRLIINVAEVESDGIEVTPEDQPQVHHQTEVVDQGLLDAERAEHEADERATQTRDGISPNKVEQPQGGQNGSGKNRGRRRNKNKNKNKGQQGNQQQNQPAADNGGGEPASEEHVE